MYKFTKAVEQIQRTVQNWLSVYNHFTKKGSQRREKRSSNRTGKQKNKRIGVLWHEETNTVWSQIEESITWERAAAASVYDPVQLNGSEEASERGCDEVLGFRLYKHRSTEVFLFSLMQITNVTLTKCVN